MVTYFEGNVPDGPTMNAYMDTLKFITNTIYTPIGFRIDTQSSSQAVQIVDVNGNSYTPPTGFFNSHPLWAGMWAAFYNRSTGTFSTGNTNIGSPKVFTGADGDVFVRIPGANYRYRFVDNRYHEHIVAPLSVQFQGSAPHPFTVMRGGTVRPFVYHSAYEASLLIDDTGNYKLQSVSGVQPVTGAAISKLQFTSGGTNAIQIDEVITGATSGAYGTVIGIQKSSGTWAGGDAAGYLFLKQITGTFQAENLNGSVAGTNCATAAGASSALSFTVTNAETYAANKGSKFGVIDIYLKAYLDLLQVIEAGTLDVPSVFGMGIVDLPVGTGFAGKVTGSDNIDSLLDSQGTGHGDGIDGQVAISWRNIRNRYGNTYKHLLGFNVFTDKAFRVTKRDGTGTLAEIMADGSYEVGEGIVPTTDGYTKTVWPGEIGGPLFVTKTNNGSSTETFGDGWFGPSSANNSIFYGGAWRSVYQAGPFMMSASSAAGAYSASLGTHFVYYP